MRPSPDFGNKIPSLYAALQHGQFATTALGASRLLEGAFGQLGSRWAHSAGSAAGILLYGGSQAPANDYLVGDMAANTLISLPISRRCLPDCLPGCKIVQCSIGCRGVLSPFADPQEKRAGRVPTYEEWLKFKNQTENRELNRSVWRVALPIRRFSYVSNMLHGHVGPETGLGPIYPLFGTIFSPMRSKFVNVVNGFQSVAH